MASMVSWISEPLPLDNVNNTAFTRGLPFSLSDISACSTASINHFTFPPDFIGSDHLVYPVSSDDLVQAPVDHREPAGSTATNRVAKRKRKSRALKRNLTTYISTDAANFRHMVQHVTGIGFDFVESGYLEHDQPGLVRPEPKRAATATMQSSCVLPTLDTSAFLLDQEGLISGAPQGKESVRQLVAGQGRQPVYQMDPLNCFPTLESWSGV